MHAPKHRMLILTRRIYPTYAASLSRLDLRLKRVRTLAMLYAISVCHPRAALIFFKFYNLVLFMSSVAAFSLIAQKMHNQI